MSELNHKKSLRRIKTATLLISIIAIIAVLLSIYAFIQKREADEQTKQAQKNLTEAMQQHQNALQQRNIADSNKDKASQQREHALESDKKALEQENRAIEEARKAELNRLEFLKQQYETKQAKSDADSQKKIAQENEVKAKEQEKKAVSEKEKADGEKIISNRLKDLDNSRRIAKEAMVMMNEDHYDSGRDKALEAYLLNNINNGPVQNSDIYDAMNMNWVNIINNKNQVNFRNAPIRCIDGIPGSDIIFSADEEGTLYKSVINDDGVQKVASYAIKKAARALAVSATGDRLALITANGDGTIFKISSTGITPLTNFKFQGSGQAVSFDAADNLIVASNKGITRFTPGDMENPVLAAKEGINVFVIGKSGIFYVAQNNSINVFRTWNDVVSNSIAATQKFDSKITSIAVDSREQYLAAGSYNGYVYLLYTTGNGIFWSRSLHISKVNDLKFSVVNGGRVQLASAGADQAIKLIDVTSFAQKESTEDILTLRGHSKWIYSLHYAQGGKWLCSAGEDNKLIAWKPTTNDLYKTLNDK